MADILGQENKAPFLPVWSEERQASNPAEPERTLRFKTLFSSPLRILIFLQAVNGLIYATGFIFLYVCLYVMDTITNNESYMVPWGSPLELAFILFAMNAPLIFALCTFIMAPILYKKYGFSPSNSDVLAVFPWSLFVNLKKIYAHP